MFLSLFIYTFTAISLYILADNARRRYGNYRQNATLLKPEYIISFLIFGFVVGARYRVGVDHLSYLEYFNSMSLPVPSKDMEPLFYAITWLFANSGLHYFFYFAFWGILQLYLVYYSFKDYRFVIPFAALYLMLGPFFFDWMNIMRQSIAVCAFTALIQYINNRKLLPFVVGVALLSMIHKSALICIPLYFIVYLPEFYQKRNLSLILYFFSILIGMSVPSINLTPLQLVMDITGYDNYNLEMTLTDEHAFAMAWGPRRLSMLFVDVVVISFFPIVYKEYGLDTKWRVFFSLFFVGACLYNIVSGISGFLVRPLNYLLIFRIPLVGLLLYYTRYKKQLVFLLLILCACTFTYIGVYTGYRNPSDLAAESCLYKFFFDAPPIH